MLTGFSCFPRPKKITPPSTDDCRPSPYQSGPVHMNPTDLNDELLRNKLKRSGAGKHSENRHLPVGPRGHGRHRRRQSASSWRAAPRLLFSPCSQAALRPSHAAPAGTPD